MRWRLRGLTRELKAMKQPEWLRYGNLGLAFLLELAALLSFAAAGVLLSGWMQLVGGIAGAAVFVLLWGIFAAPRSKRRLKGMNLLLFKIGIFAVAGAILVAIGQPAWGAVLVLLAAGNLTLGQLLRQH
jgi:hypothetical protein